MTDSGRKEALAVLRVLRANRALLLGTNPGSQQKSEVQLFAEPPRSFAFDGVLRESGPCFQLCGLSRTRRLAEIVVRGPRHRRRFFNSLALVWRNFVSAGPSLNSKGKSPAVQSFRTTRYNGSIYVYGQTGSGKTHTMQGEVVVASGHSSTCCREECKEAVCICLIAHKPGVRAVYAQW